MRCFVASENQETGKNGCTILHWCYVRSRLVREVEVVGNKRVAAATHIIKASRVQFQ